MKRLILAIFVIFSSLLHADEPVGPWRKGKLSTINLGTRFITLIQKRGVVFYKNYQFDPVVVFFFFDDKVEFLGDSIGFRDFVHDDKIRLRTRFVNISDDPIFPNDKSVHDSSPHRKNTYEWSNSIEFFLPGYNKDYVSELALTLSKDLKRHEGHYVEALGKLKLFSFNRLNTEFEINLFSTLGWGDGPHNGYFYGADVEKGGFNNWSKGLWLTLPDKADRYFSIIQLSHYQALGPFRDGAFAKGRNEGFMFSLIASYGVLK